MEKSTNYNFNLPNSANDEIADINDISDNFRIIDEKLKIDQTFSETSENPQSGKAIAGEIGKKQDYFADISDDSQNRDINLTDKNRTVVGQIVVVSTEGIRYTNILTPENETDGANKKYVDDVKSYSNNAFANALKGNATGQIVSLPDISPNEHTLGVKAKSKNLFDKNNANIIAGYIDANVITAATASRCIYIPCNPNTTYTVSKIATARFVVAFTNVIPTAGTAVTNQVQNYTATSITATSGADSKYIVVWLYNSVYDTTTTIDEILATVQIELGTAATSYTPYISDLSTVTVTRRGKNLFDINNPTYAALSKANAAFLPTIEDGVISFDTHYSIRGGSGFVIPVEPNTTITISFDSVGSGYWTEIMAVESILDNVAINFYKYPQFKNITKYTLTQRADKHYILFILDGINGYHTAKIKNLQIEKGSTATPYEPYQGHTYTPTATGEVVGVTSLYPTTTLITDTEGVIIEAEYNRDINKAFAEMQQAILSMGGNT